MILAGYNSGSSIIRSVDGGATWATVSSVGNWWSSSLCTDAEPWIYAGSSYYTSSDPWDEEADVRTLLYSSDQGQSWNDLPQGGAFNYIARDVVYGNGVWVASGLEGIGEDSYAQFRTSVDGIAWTSFTINGLTVYPTDRKSVV